MINRRMGRFKRPLDLLLPKYRRFKASDNEDRIISFNLGATDMAENDSY